MLPRLRHYLMIPWFLLPMVILAQEGKLNQKDTTPDVQQLLSLSLEELMDIKVSTAAGFFQSVTEAPSTITVITAQQIADRGYNQLEDALLTVMHPR